MKNKIKNLAELRQEIDEIDYAILDLLKERADLAKEIAKVKKPLQRSPEREAQVLDILKQRNSDDGKTVLDNSYIVSLWEKIFAYSIKIQNC